MKNLKVCKITEDQLGIFDKDRPHFDVERVNEN